ncbi:hypothetical protein C8J56DRAFT_1049503 [Mycena floridula]|nr:hypothetical protein C8J56DRAFT_1049503 [Mycena floridula]
MATALLPVVTVPVTASVAAPVTTPVVHVTVDAYDDMSGNEVPPLADAWGSDEAGEPYESDNLDSGYGSERSYMSMINPQ